MEKVLFLESPVKEKIYGGHAIMKMLGVDDDRKIGEYWAISAHDNGPSIIANGQWQGKTLKETYEKHRDLFDDSKSEKFPLLIKLNEVTSPVSVQVHPDDAYAQKYEHDSGKAEFCLFLHVEPGGKLVRGHTAKTKEEFKEMVEAGRFDELLVRKPTFSNDYVYTPAGIIHGIEAKVFMAEVQQSSDVTYRIYDYDNVGLDGKPRPLHIDKAIETACIPHQEPKMDVKDIMIGNNRIITYVDNQYFKVTRAFVNGSMDFINKSYACIVVLSGEGTLVIDEDEYALKPGQSFIVTSYAKTYGLKGNVEALISEPPRE